eukprot:434367_1
MNNLFAEIQSAKQKKKLKKTNTKVTQRDGKVFITQKTDDGEFKQQYKETVDISTYLNEKELTKEEVKDHDDYVQLFDIENWYKDIKSITFDTYFIPLTIQNAELITNMFIQFHKEQKSNEWINQQIHSNKSLTILCNKINEIININKMNGCFCKLSSRSPKDSTDDKLQKMFNEKIQDLKKKK